jgi:hypothetical protein
MTFITTTCLFDTGLWNTFKKKVKRVVENHGYARAANELERHGFRVAAQNARNFIKLGGIN